jgi:hypothetical protein
VFGASLVVACLVALVGCNGGSTVAPDDDLTPKEVQTFMREEAGIALRVNREHSEPTLTLLRARDFDLWVYAAADFNKTIDKIGDLFNPEAGTRVFGPWHSYESDILGDLGYYQVAVAFERGLVLRYILSSVKVKRPCCEIADPVWYEEVVEHLSDLTGTRLPE